MGGHALKKVTTRRYDSQEYHELVKEVLSLLRTGFPDETFNDIPAYATKPSFGDMDVLTTLSVGATEQTMEKLNALFAPNQVVRNGAVTSFDYKSFQIDLIYASPEEYPFTYHYFSYNDLGNLLGKIAHKFGLKYGHDGLWYLVREGDYLQNTILLTKNPEQALAIIGLTPHPAPFQTLEEVFAYVASSPYFSPKYYLKSDSEKNATDRVRENKRQSYQAFLTWLETHQPTLTHFEPNRDKSTYLHTIDAHFPGFLYQYQAVKSELQAIAHQKAVIDAKFDPVRMLGGLGVAHDDKKTFGAIMAAFTASFESKDARQTWLYHATEQEISARLMQIKEQVNGR